MDKNNKRSIAVISIIAILIITLTVVIALLIQNMKIVNSLRELNNKGSVILSADDLNEIETLEGQLSKLRSAGLYLEVQNGSESIIDYVYNANGEGLSQRAYKMDMLNESNEETQVDMMETIIYRNDGKSISYGEYLEYGDTPDILTLIENSIQAAKSGIAIIEVKPETQDFGDKKFKEVYIDIRSYANINSFYSMINDAYAYEEVESLRYLVSKYKEADNSLDIEHVNMRFSFYIDESNNALNGVKCNLYFGTSDGPDAENDNARVFWELMGYHVLADSWTLDDEWYNTDWSNVDKWEDEDITKAENLLTDLYNEVVPIIKNHFNTGEHAEEIVKDPSSSSSIAK